jgi:hypothetical protein
MEEQNECTTIIRQSKSLYEKNPIVYDRYLNLLEAIHHYKINSDNYFHMIYLLNRCAEEHINLIQDIEKDLDNKLRRK